MAGMHLHLNSEDQALLKAVELAVAMKGEGAAAGDATVEGLAYKLAASTPVAAEDFQAGLLQRLKSVMASGEMGPIVDTDGIMQDIRGEIVENNVAVVPDVAWDKNAGGAGSRVRSYYRESHTAQNAYQRFWVSFAAIAALLVFSIGLVALLASRSSYLGVPSSVNIATPTGYSAIAAAPTSTTAAMAEPTATTAAMAEPTEAAGIVDPIILPWSPPYFATPVNSADVIGSWKQLFVMNVATDTKQIDWSPDSRYLAMRTDSFVSFYDFSLASTSVPAGNFSINAEKRLTDTLAYAPSGKGVALGSSDGTVLLLTGSGPSPDMELSQPNDAGKGSPVAVDEYKRADGPRVAWNSDGTLLASVGNFREGTQVQGFVFIWDFGKAGAPLVYTLTVDSAELNRLIGSQNVGMDRAIEKIAWAPTQRRLAVLYGNSLIALWDVETGKLERTMYDVDRVADSDTLLDIAWSRNGKSIAQPMKQQVDVWNVEIGTADGLRRVPADSAGVLQLDLLVGTKWSTQWTFDGGTLATLGLVNASGEARLDIWDTYTSDPSIGKTFKSLDAYQVSSDAFQSNLLGWSPDGQVLAYVMGSGVALWSMATRSDMRVLSVDSPQGIWWSPDGSRLAVLGSDGLEIWGEPPSAEVSKEKEKPPP